MESIHCLVDAHLKTRKLEKEIDKVRCDLINEYMRENDSDTNSIDLLKEKLYEICAKLKKEMNDFEKALKDLDDNSHEMVDNTEYDDSSTKSNEALYGYSVPVTDAGDALSFYETKEETQNIAQSNEALYGYSYDRLKEETKVETHEPIIEKENIEFDDSSTKSVETKSVLSDNKSIISSRNRVGQRMKVRCGYKYGGKGFNVFSGRNKCKPIYSSTMLFCRETCFKNKEDLKNYLIKFGRFKCSMIEDILFKESRDYRHYALVKVRGPLKVIKNKIKALNKAKGKGKDLMHIFERTRFVSGHHRSNVLYVNNFDILRKDSHKKFTNLFLKYGELIMDITMGKDKNGDAFAIVRFRDLEDAQRCVQDKEPIFFDGKILNISYSKF